MSREVCGVCWTPYDDGYKCACPTPALDTINCPRCGKRLGGPEHVHTCTPRRLTDEVIADLWAKNGTYHHHFARAIERWLKGEQ